MHRADRHHTSHTVGRGHFPATPSVRQRNLILRRNQVGIGSDQGLIADIVWLTQDNRSLRRAGISLCTNGSGPVLQASAINTAQRLVLKSAARAVRSVMCVKASVKPVRAAISSRISGKSTRGSLVATASRKAKSDGGSSSLSKGLKTRLILFCHPRFRIAQPNYSAGAPRRRDRSDPVPVGEPRALVPDLR